MKKLLLLWLCALCVVISGCSDSDDPAPTPELTIQPATPIVFSSDGGSVEIIVTTNQTSWTAVSDKAWCVVAQGADRFTVTAAANPTTESMPQATITITAGTDSQVINTTLSVSQKGVTATNLSESAKANCYVISAAGTYSFDATVRGNGATTEALSAPTPIAATSAELVWQTTAGMIENVNLANGKVIFTATATPGNALIAVKNASGEICWSWHIWHPEVEISALTSSTGYQVMNMNLGAMCNERGDARSYGLLYQWGRKDPFTASATPTGTTSTVGAPLYDADGHNVTISNSSWSNTTANTIDYAIAHPTVCISNYSQYATSRDWLKADQSNNALWGNPQGAERDTNNNFINQGAKSFYDPCPAGWRVPAVDVFRNFTSSGGYNWVITDFDIFDINGDGNLSIDDYNYGWTFNLSGSAHSYFPAAARYDGSYAMLMGSMSGLWGSYWGNAPYPGSMFQGGAYAVISYQIKDQVGNDMITASPIGGGARADAYAIRCVKE